MALNVSASFIAEKTKIKNRNDINSNANNHPTVGAFGYTKAGTFESEYIYSYDPNLETYKFRTPNPFPGPAPAKSSGAKWDVIEGIGAGPILVINHKMITANV